VETIGYVRCSTSEQADSGLGLKAQRAAIRAEAQRRGWQLISIEEDAGVSGKSLSGRPGLEAALNAVSTGTAQALVVAKLDRLSRSLLDFAGLMAKSQKQGWALVALDLGVDTTTPAGEFMASVLASAAQWERRIIGQRTKDALAVKRAQGVQLGRRRSVASETIELIAAMRRDGQSLRAIADQLNEEGVPTAEGKKWYAATIRRVLEY
jgi:DNA invertase Pin-like site-specific DNA recombinase